MSTNMVDEDLPVIIIGIVAFIIMIIGFILAIVPLVAAGGMVFGITLPILLIPER